MTEREVYKPYLQDGEVHVMGGRELSTNYMSAFYGAFVKLNNKTAASPLAPAPVVEEEAPVVVEETPVKEIAIEEDVIEEPVQEEVVSDEEAIVEEIVEVNKPKKTRKVKKNFGAMITTFISTLLIVAVAVLSSFKALKVATYYFTNAGTREIFGFLANANVSGLSLGNTVLTYAVPGTALLTALFVIITLIVSLVAIAGKKKINACGALMLVALIAWVACGVVAYFGGEVARDGLSVHGYINPMEEGGIAWGFYIVAALLLIGTITGFKCYKKKVAEIVL